MPRLIRLGAALAVGFGLAFAAAGARADIVVGQIAPIDGVLAGLGQQIVAGAKIWFDRVNAQGGIHGQRIKHRVQNDRFDVPETIRNTKALIETDKPAALIGYLGTANMVGHLQDGVLQRADLALVAPYSGSVDIRAYPWYFHVRASYADETAHIADHLATLGLKRVAVFYQDEAFGHAGLKGFEEAARQFGIKIAVKSSYQLNKPKAESAAEIAAAAKTIAAAGPLAVVMISNTWQTAQFAKAYRKVDGNGLLFNVSVLDTELLVKEAGLDAVRGMGITQIVPYPFSGVTPLVKEFRQDFAKYAPKGTPMTYAVFETYIGARVLTEALKRAGKEPTSGKVVQALHALGRFDLGGFTLDYSRGNTAGSRFVEIVVIGADGRLLK